MAHNIRNTKHYSKVHKEDLRPHLYTPISINIPFWNVFNLFCPDSSLSYEKWNHKANSWTDCLGVNSDFISSWLVTPANHLLSLLELNNTSKMVRTVPAQSQSSINTAYYYITPISYKKPLSNLIHTDFSFLRIT